MCSPKTSGAIQQILDKDGETSQETSQDSPTENADCVPDVEYGGRPGRLTTVSTNCY